MVRMTPLRGGILIGAVLILTLGFAIGVVAQSDDTVVTLIDIDSQNFPEVIVPLAISDANGPVVGLTIDDFQIEEDGLAQPAAIVDVESARLDGLRLVLAIDLSVPNNDLNAIKAGVSELISSIGPKDKLAIITFDNEVNQAYNLTEDPTADFTNNQTALGAVIENLKPQGDRTALHRAIAEATEMLEALPDGRQKGIMAITDSRDNTGVLAAEAAIGGVLQAKLPLYVIGFGEKVQEASSFKDQVNSTRGNYVTLANSAQILTTIRETEDLLRAGYKLTFRSGLKAGNVERQVAVVVNHPSGVGRGVGQFKAIPGQIRVALPDITPEQSVSGIVELTPEIEIKPSVSSYTVTYLLDDQELTEITAQPYTFGWDTASAGPGPHTLIVKVVDSAGNLGQTEAPVIVVAPVKVVVSASKDEIEIGERVNLETIIEASSEIVKVDLLLNGEPELSSDTPPFNFAVDESLYQTPGEYKVTVRVTDRSGQQGEDSLSLTVLPAPPPEPSLMERIRRFFASRRFIDGVTIIAALAVSLLLLFLGLILLRFIIAMQRRRSNRLCRLEVVNQGNIPSRYTLRALESGDNLKFRFSLNGITLPLQLIPQTAGATVSQAAAEQAYPTATRSGSAALAPTAALAPAGYQGPSTVSRPIAPTAPSAGGQGRARASQALEKAQATEAKASGCLYTIIDIFDSVASILPSAIGRPLRRMSESLYSGQRAVDRAKMAPSQVVRTTQYVKGEVSRNLPAGSQPGDAASQPAADASLPPQTVAEGGLEEGEVQPVAASPPAPKKKRRKRSRTKTAPLGIPNGWSETPPIEPGDKLLVEMLIVPEQPFKKQSYDITVTSKSMEETRPSAFEEKAEVQIRGLFWPWRYLPRALVLLITLGLIIAVISAALGRVAEVNVLDYLLV